ncbi:MAG: hypothetical protein ACFFB0_07640 [Promethearchaeota archaeon]
MGAGKVLCILGGIISIVSTFILSWISLDIGGTDYFAYGIGVVKNLMNMFTDAETLGTTLGIPGFAIYIIAVILIIFLISGIFQIIGVKSRAMAIIGSIFVILVGVLIFLGAFNVVDAPAWVENIFGDSEPLVEGIIPFDLPLGPVSLGTYILLAGGVLGLIGGIIGPESY